MLAGTVKIPGVGTVPKKYAFAGAGVVLLILGVAYWRHRNAPPVDDTAADPTQASTTDPTAGSTDPSGYQPGYSQAPYWPYGYDVYGNPLPAPTGASGTGGQYTDNLSWEQAATTALERAGIAESVSVLAISRVLAGLPVTEAQMDIFLQAVGLLGQPPQGYPTPIKLSATSGSGPTTPAAKPGAPANLHRGTATSGTVVEIAWNRVNGAAGYVVQAQGEGGSWQIVGKPSGGTNTRFIHRGLRAGTRHTYRVAAYNSAGTGNYSGRLTVTTPKPQMRIS